MSERSKDLTAAIHKIGDNFDTFVKNWTEPVEDLFGRVEELESRKSMPGHAGGAETAEQREHKQRFETWLRNPRDSAAKNALSEMQGRLSTKAVTIGSDPGGGFAVPEEIARDIERHELKLSPVRSLVKVRQVGSSDYKELVNIRGATSGWVGETGTRSETVTPLLRERAPTFGELYAYPHAWEWALQDVFFDVNSWLAEEAGEQFALSEGEAVIRGDGSNKPTGMINTTPVATADAASPLRAAAAYQFVPSLSTSSPAVAEILPDALIDLMFAVNARYRAGASWVMNSTTAGEIRKLKDAQNRYLWTDGLQAGQPNILLGHPVVIWEQMDDIGTNNFPVAFGNFMRGYLLADRSQLRITVDDNITTPGKVKYYLRRREGGAPLNNDAIKFLRTTVA